MNIMDDELREAATLARNEAIEQCARRAKAELESLLSPYAFSGTIATVVAAIRALKESA